MAIDIKLAIKQLTAADLTRVPIADTGKYDELREKAIRDLAKNIGYYAESGSLFDVEGKYLCDDCALRTEPRACTFVSGKISMQTGSCMIWVHGNAIDLPVGQKLTQIEANYCERPKAKAFGCSRCGWYAQAKQADSNGRPGWCSWWGMHAVPLACCIAESGPDLKVAPGE